MAQNNNGNGGIGFLGLLTILFIGLKLGKVISWSWLWVLSPMWIPMSIGFGLILIILIMKGLVK